MTVAPSHTAAAAAASVRHLLHRGMNETALVAVTCRFITLASERDPLFIEVERLKRTFHAQSHRRSVEETERQLGLYADRLINLA